MYCVERAKIERRLYLTDAPGDSIEGEFHEVFSVRVIAWLAKLVLGVYTRSNELLSESCSRVPLVFDISFFVCWHHTMIDIQRTVRSTCFFHRRS